MSLEEIARENGCFRRKLAGWPVWTCEPPLVVARPEESRVRNAAPRVHIDGAIEQRLDWRPVGERVRTAAERSGAEQLRRRARQFPVDAHRARRDAVDGPCHRGA